MVKGWDWVFEVWERWNGRSVEGGSIEVVLLVIGRWKREDL